MRDEDLKRALAGAAAALASDAAATRDRAESQETAAQLWREEQAQLETRLRGLLRRRAEVDRRHRVLRACLQRRAESTRQMAVIVGGAGARGEQRPYDDSPAVEVDYGSMVFELSARDICAQPLVAERRPFCEGDTVDAGCATVSASDSRDPELDAWLRDPWSSTALCTGWEAVPATAWEGAGGSTALNHFWPDATCENGEANWVGMYGIEGVSSHDAFGAVAVEDDHHWSAAASYGYGNTDAEMWMESECFDVEALILPPVLPAPNEVGADGAFGAAAAGYLWSGDQSGVEACSAVYGATGGYY